MRECRGADVPDEAGALGHSVPPGGGTDTISRTLAQKLTEIWGHQVISDNRPGSGGAIGMAIAAKLPPDGYNLVLGQLANVAIAPALYPKLQ